MIVLYFLAFSLLLGLLLKWKWQEYQILSKLKWTQVIQGDPIFGNALRFSKNPKGYLQEFDNITKSSESGTVVLPALLYTGICSINADLFDYILSSTELLVKADAYRFFFRWLGSGLITASGDKWKTRRRLLTPTFHKTVLESFIEIIDKKALEFVENMKEKSTAESFDIYPHVNFCTLNIVCETMMGLSLIDDNNLSLSKSAYSKHLHEVCNLISERIFSIYKNFDILYSFTNSYKKEIKVTDTLHAFTKMVINKKRQQLKKEKSESDVNFNIDKKNQRKAFLDLLLELELDGEPLSDEEIREQVDTFMFGGHDTTASGISFTLYCLSQHPEIQKKAIEEQQQIFGKDKNRPITSEDIKNMSYLELIIKESLRLYPPVPFIARNIHKDSEYKGNIIPKGIYILLFIYGLHRNPKYFENPEEFQPERFKNFDLKHQHYYLPFGSGLRGCMGKEYSIMQMKCVLSRFIQNYEILPPTPENDIKLIAQTVIKSSNGINCGIRRREWK